MDLLSIAMKLGGAALKSVPIVGGVVNAIEFINDILPKDKQLNENSTGDETLAAIKGMPAEDQSKVLEKQFDVQLAEIKADVEKTKALADVDIAGKSTRPHIAKVFAWNTVIVSDIVIGGIVYAVVKDQVAMITQIKGLWPFIIAVLAPFVIVVKQYFGLRTKEKQQKYEAVTGTSAPMSLIDKVIGRWIK